MTPGARPTPRQRRAAGIFSFLALAFLPVLAGPAGPNWSSCPTAPFPRTAKRVANRNVHPISAEFFEQ